MTAKIIDGKLIGDKIRDEIIYEAKLLKQKYGIIPGLAVIIVGDNPASQVYVRMKEKTCIQIGFYSQKHELPQNTSQQQLLSLISSLNSDENIHGILVQLPLPKHITEAEVTNAIDPDKDVDGFHPFNVGKLLIGLDTFIPCTPYGIQELLIRSGVETNGAHLVIVGRSNIVGKPLGAMMMQKAKGANCTVTICHSATKNISYITKQADILVAAIGSPEFIKKPMVKERAVVIDVGVNRINDPTALKGYRLVGDVDFDEVKEIASAITPVPGGVGPMTITMLMKNTLKAAKMSIPKRE